MPSLRTQPPLTGLRRCERFRRESFWSNKIHSDDIQNTTVSVAKRPPRRGAMRGYCIHRLHRTHSCTSVEDKIATSIWFTLNLCGLEANLYSDPNSSLTKICYVVLEMIHLLCDLLQDFRSKSKYGHDST